MSRPDPLPPTSREVHRMTTEFVADRQLVRYSCAICQCCYEDGPDGLRLIHKGDARVAHRGGVLRVEQDDIDPGPDGAPVLH